MESSSRPSPLIICLYARHISEDQDLSMSAADTMQLTDIPHHSTVNIETSQEQNYLQHLETNLNHGQSDMPLDVFMDWFVAIRENRYEYVRNILDRDLLETQRDILVNGNFTSEKNNDSRIVSDDERALNCQFSVPLLVAAVFSSRETLQHLYRHNGDINKTDFGDNNIIHALVFSEVVSPGGQSETFDVILKCLSGNSEKLRQLFLTENKNGRRPLELATELGAFTMSRKILSVDGVYRFPGPLPLFRREVWYDVTDYETYGGNNGRHFSPLELIANAKTLDVQGEAFKKLFNIPFIQGWISHKVASNRAAALVWIFIRLTYHVTFFTDDPSLLGPCPRQQLTNSTISQIQTTKQPNVHLPTIFPSDVFIFLYSSIVILYDILSIAWGLARHAKQRTMPDLSCGFLSKVVSFVFERIGMHCQSLLYIVNAVNFMFNTCNLNTYSLFYILMNMLNISNMLVCLKTFPVIGYFIITFHELLWDMLNFLLLFGLIHVTLSITMFYTIQILQLSDPNYPSIPVSMYSNFKVILNMVSFDKYIDAHGNVMLLMHELIVIIMAIILVNLAVAVMSNTVSAIFTYKDLALELYKLSVALVIENRMKALLKKVAPRAKLRVPGNALRFKDGKAFVSCFETGVSDELLERPCSL